MTGGPSFFEPIRRRASQLWDQLESDPVLAGPWHQLFKQVQSPRHILSELLQNADDAGATEATVHIEEGAFVFEHNGEDFTEEHFASLCRFGYSNKRTLHTIGFRGIGFKSTFSLGDRVELYTPTLGVAFDRERFTEPKWISNEGRQNGNTVVRVAIEDEHRRREVEKNLEEWAKSPVSLLFFKSIRRMQIGTDEVHWGELGPGPTPNTEWLALHDNPDKPYLFARSEPEDFPSEALAEIKQERMLTDAEETNFPPCTVEIVLGAGGRLFVVLPTGVKTELPFACNAPFIQDPARLKIKDPETSPTNRWLLQRAGRLAAEAMLNWLTEGKGSLEDRAQAYGLLPDVDREDNSLEGICSTIAELAFEEAVDGSDFLLTDGGQLTASAHCVTIPSEVFDVWPGSDPAPLIDDDGRPALSRHVSEPDSQKLVNWKFVDEIDDDDFLYALHQKHLPRPKTWKNLLKLWAYIAPAITSYHYHRRAEELRIVPVQGKDVLCASDEVVRLGEKRLLPSGDDWAFLGDRLFVLNQNWLRFLTEQKRISESNKDTRLSEEVDAAYAVIEEIGLDQPSDTGKVIDRVAADFFAAKEVSLADAVRIAQIAAKLGASVGPSFRFATQDRRLRATGYTVLFDGDGTLELLLPKKWVKEHILHADYTKAFTSCSREEWARWVSSGQSGLQTFVPIVENRDRWLSRSKIDSQLQRRGYRGHFAPRYKSPWFHLDDKDFDADVWEHWETLAKDDESLWGNILERIILEPERFWSGNLTASITEEANNGHTRRVVREGLVPQWIMRFREKPCVRDIHGFYRKPEELLCRTPETEALLDVEIFVDGHLDTEKTRPLLKLLGVGDTPTGPGKLISRVRALSKSEAPPLHEVEKWYRRLDLMIDNCSTDEFSEIRNAFSTEKLILTENGSWETLSGVFLSADEEDAPGAETIRRSQSDLTMWRKLGVAERPTADLAIAWLQGLPSGKQLSQDEARRVRALLSRYPLRIWEECQHWFSLAGEWAPIGKFSYALTMQTLIPWGHLHPWVKEATADLQRLPTEVIEAAPFSEVPLLAAHVEERFHLSAADAEETEERAWLHQLGRDLQRIQLDDEDETARIRSLGIALAETLWATSPGLETISYIDGKPAGTARHAEAIWASRVLYVEDRPAGRLARAVSQELGRSFRRPEIVDAIKLCYDRPAAFVSEYMEENFDLNPLVEWQSKQTINDSNRDMEESDSSGDIPSEDEVEEVEEAGDVDETVVGDDLPHELDPEEANDTSDGDADIPDDDDEDEAPLPIRHTRATKPKPSLMERFALSSGFRKDSDSRYFDDAGNWIGRSTGELFPWQQRDASGNVVRHYWPKEHCLEAEPLEIQAEIWSVIEQSPDAYALVLQSPEGKPVEVSGARLNEMREDGGLTLHPSTYRLVVEKDG